MAQNLKACVVQIRDASGLIHGTGFLVGPDTVATCAHVIEAAGAAPGGSVSVAFPLTGEACPAQVLTDAWRPAGGEDVAILRLQAEPPAGLVPAVLGPSEDTAGHPFRAFGYPVLGDVQGVFAQGEILGPVTDSQGTRILQLRAQEIAQGMSGAPVLDVAGDRVVGIVTATYQPDGTLKFRDAAFATPSETITQAWPVLKVTPPPSSWERLRQRPLAIQLLATGGALIALLVVVALLFRLPRDLEDSRQPGGWLHPLWPAPTATPAPMSERGLNIAVAQFTAPGEAVKRPVSPESQVLSEWLFRAIDQEAGSFRDSSLSTLSFEVRGPEQIGPVLGDDPEARAANAGALARQHNATILIYGLVSAGADGHYVQPEFYVSEGGFGYGSEVIGPNRLGQPVRFEPPLGQPGTLLGVNQKLDARVAALRHLVRGLAHFYVAEYEKAYIEFEDAAHVRGWEPEEGQEVVYLLMGAAMLRIYDEPRKEASGQDELRADLERRAGALGRAGEAFSEAYQLNPGYARSYLGLGAVALQQATLLDSEWNRIVGVDSDKLIEAEGWYSDSLSAPDQPASAYVPVKVAYGLGQIHLVGHQFGVPGWSVEDARRFLNQVVSAYDPERAPELDWLVGDAHTLLCRLEAQAGDWEAVSSECRKAVDVLSSIPYDSNRLRTKLANSWVWVAWAEKELNQTDEASWAYRQAKEIGEAYISPQLAAWQTALDCLEKGEPCREP